MTDNTQPAAGSTHIIRYALEMGLLWIDGDGRDKVREALDALDTLEAQLASIGAGGVSALMGAAKAGSEPVATVFTMEAAAAELRRLHALTTQQQRDLIAESHRTAEQKLRADQMTTQHAHQAALNTEARAQLAAALTAQAISKAPDHIAEVGNMVAQAISAEPAGAGYAELPDAKTLGEAVAAWIGVETRGAHNWVDTTVDRLGFAVRSVMGDMLRASHGQAPAQPSDPHAELRKAWTPGHKWQWTSAAEEGRWWSHNGEPEWNPEWRYRLAPARPVAEPSQFGSPELQAMILARCIEKDRASHGQAPAVKRVFTNELGNSIRITVEGPNSMHENIVTPMEAKQLREALNEHAQKSAPAQAAPAAVAGPDEIDRLRAALVYVAFALHGTRQYMLAEGVTLIDGFNGHGLLFELGHLNFSVC